MRNQVLYSIPHFTTKGLAICVRIGTRRKRRIFCASACAFMCTCECESVCQSSVWTRGRLFAVLCAQKKSNGLGEFAQGHIASAVSLPCILSQYHDCLANLYFPSVCHIADIISTVEFDHTGDYLATGDKGGRVVLFERNESVRS